MPQNAHIVKGDGRHPLYDGLIAAHPHARKKPDSQLEARLESKGLITERKPDDILWNFEKFVVGGKNLSP